MNLPVNSARLGRVAAQPALIELIPLRKRIAILRKERDLIDHAIVTLVALSKLRHLPPGRAAS